MPVIRDLVEEYEARQSLEARFAKDADKLECLIQAREYQAQGHEDVPPLDRNLAAALRSLRPATRRGLSAGTTATVVEGLRGVVSTADQGCGPAVYRGPLERSASTRLIGARGSTQGLIPRSFQVLVTTFSSICRSLLRAAVRPSSAGQPARRCKGGFINGRSMPRRSARWRACRASQQEERPSQRAGWAVEGTGGGPQQARAGGRGRPRVPGVRVTSTPRRSASRPAACP